VERDLEQRSEKRQSEKRMEGETAEGEAATIRVFVIFETGSELRSIYTKANMATFHSFSFSFYYFIYI